MRLAKTEANRSADETNAQIKHPDPIEEGKVEDQKRKFMTPLRPHQKIWNFDFTEEQCGECKEGDKTGCCGEKPKHVLRSDADPRKCYIDGRIEKFLALVDKMAESLKTFSAERWTNLCNATAKIFVAQDIQDNLDYQAFTSSQSPEK